MGIKTGNNEALKYAYEPQRINILLAKALKVYAGFSHCMAITGTDVLVWGSNKEGQLGFTIDKDFVEEPITIDELSGKNVKKG